MRVCILTPEFLPTWGGIGTYTYNLARGLRDRAEVHVVTAGGKSRHPAPEGVQVHEIRTEGTPAGSMGLSFQMAVFRRLPALAQAFRFDLVHANHAYMSDLLLGARRLSARRVVTVHTTLGTQIEGTLRAQEPGGSTPTERTIARWRPVFRRIERHYLRRRSAMIFVSEWVRRRALDGYGLKPHLSTVIPNGIDTHGLARDHGTDLGGGHGGRTLLFAGRLLALKGVGTLIRALARLDPSVRLLLAGPGDPRPWLALALRLGVDVRRCGFLGPVPYAQMPALYRAVDAVVLPSFTESCPMVALEAMAVGTPLIAAGAGGVLEIVEDGETGWLFHPGSVDGLVDRIETVLADPAQAGRVSARARAWVEANATLARMTERTFRFYESVCGEAS